MIIIQVLHTATKIQFMYSFLGIARPKSQFSHSCVCERFIYSQDRSTYLAAAKKLDRSWKYINLSQIYECKNWETEHYNTVLEIRRLHSAQFHFWKYIDGNHAFIFDSRRPFICSAFAETDNAAKVQMLLVRNLGQPFICLYCRCGILDNVSYACTAGAEPWTTFHIPCNCRCGTWDNVTYPLYCRCGTWEP
jgi:hypothetical protein